MEEQLELSKRKVERGRVVVRTYVEERDEVAEIELQQQDVTIERIAHGVAIETAPAVREEDGVLIIPVVEEQLVVTTRLILKEEIRITRHSRTEFAREPVGSDPNGLTSSGWKVAPHALSSGKEFRR